MTRQVKRARWPGVLKRGVDTFVRQEKPALFYTHGALVVHDTVLYLSLHRGRIGFCK